MPIVFKYIKLLTSGEPGVSVGFHGTDIPPPWVGMASSAVLKAVAVLTMALIIAHALVLLLANILHTIWSCHRHHQEINYNQLAFKHVGNKQVFWGKLINI